MLNYPLYSYSVSTSEDFSHTTSDGSSDDSLVLDLFRKLHPIRLRLPFRHLDTSTQELNLALDDAPDNSITDTNLNQETALNLAVNSLYDLPRKILENSIQVEPIEQPTLQYAEQFLRHHHQLILGSNLAWKIPHFATEGEGEVTLEWWNNGKVLTIFVNTSGHIEYLRAWGPNIWNDMEDSEDPTDGVLSNLWQWLFD